MYFATFVDVFHQQHKDSLSTILSILLDFKIKLRDQDKARVPHKVGASCGETSRSWSHGKDKHLLFGIPMIWRENIDNVAERYFCMVNVKCFNKKNKHLRQYPNFQSA